MRVVRQPARGVPVGFPVDVPRPHTVVAPPDQTIHRAVRQHGGRLLERADGWPAGLISVHALIEIVSARSR